MSYIGTQYNLQEILVAEPKVLDRDQLNKAVTAASNNGLSLFDSLISEGIIAEETLLDILSERLGIEKVDLVAQEPAAEAINLVPAELAVKRHCIPVQVKEGVVHVAVSDPTDYQLLDELRLLLCTNSNGKTIEPFFCL